MWAGGANEVGPLLGVESIRGLGGLPDVAGQHWGRRPTLRNGAAARRCALTLL